MTDLHDLELLLRSDIPILLIESLEEPRIVELAARLALRISEPVFCWTVTEGLRRIDLDAGVQRHLAEPPEVLRHIKVTPQRGIYLLLDFHPFLDNPLHVRLVKEIAQGYGELPRSLVLVSHSLTAPPEIRHLCARFDLRLPDRNRILALIREEAQRWQHDQAKRPFRANREAVERLSRNLLGVTESDARRLIRKLQHLNDGTSILALQCVDGIEAVLDCLQPQDQVKFVICDRQDYEWARFKLDEYGLPGKVADILFSPSFGQVEGRELAEWILEDNLPVRFQLQLHKLLWNDSPGH